MTAANRKVPRPFSLHWGSGQIEEEASHVGRYHEPAVQLLRYDDGSTSIRFCYYNHTGRFQRSPMMIGDDEIEGLREALQETPELRAVLRRLVD